MLSVLACSRRSHHECHIPRIGRAIEHGMRTALERIAVQPASEAFVSAAAAHGNEPPTRAAALTSQAIHLIGRDFANLTSVRNVARRLDVHPVHLARSFSRSTSLSLSQYLRAFKVGVAIAYLAVTDEKAAAIAAASGFGGRTTLFRVVATMSRLSPGQWRAAYQRSH